MNDQSSLTIFGISLAVTCPAALSGRTTNCLISGAKIRQKLQKPPCFTSKVFTSKNTFKATSKKSRASATGMDLPYRFKLTVIETPW